MTNLSFWAQSLDNQAPDLIFRKGEELSDDESRQELVLAIDEIPKSNIKTSPTNSDVTIRSSDKNFVIEVISTEKDQANRLAPIVIYGALPERFSEDWVKDVCNEIKSFVPNTLKRTLEQGDLEAIENMLNEIPKKNRITLPQIFRLLTKIVNKIQDFLKFKKVSRY